MTILFPALAVACGAFCVWLVVRLVNRRERWAKWTAACVLLGLVVYFSAYASMVNGPRYFNAMGVGPWELPPDYRGPNRDRDQQFWKSVFGPAHWLDIKVRRSKWFLE
jgi:hypothetical protein